MEYAVQAMPYLAYTGANGADIIAAINVMRPEATIVSDTGSALTISTNTTLEYIGQFTADVGDRIGVGPVNWGVVSQLDWSAQYAKA